jgi:hypothetical protein
MSSQWPSISVFPSPSKIPYGGFSPVRLQTEIQPPPSSTLPGLSTARIRPETRLISGHRPGSQPLRPTEGLTVGEAGAPASSGTAARHTGRFRPEALGSPTGYSVPPGHRLLWPHPSLSFPSTHLWIRGWVLQPRGLPRAENERFPNLLPVAVPSCRPTYPGGPDGCLWLCFTIRTGLRHFRTGSASTSPTRVGSSVGRVTRLQGSLNATARRLARPSPTRAFTLELSPDWITPGRRRV